MRWITMTATVCVLASSVQAADVRWKQQIEGASPGQEVVLPAGTLQLADVRVPAGVTLRGAGYRQTILDASGGSDGLLPDDGAQVRDLTVRGAPGAGVRVQVDDVLLSGVRIERCMTGVVLSGADRARLENCILYANRTGVAASGGADLQILNNTFYNNSSLGLSLIGTTSAAVGNNIVANSATAVYLDRNENLILDHNLYLANYIGKIPGHPATISVQRWRDLVGQDAHSFQEVIGFVDAEAGVFEPASRLSWHPGRAPSGGFGALWFGQAQAPAVDTLGNRRDPAHIDLGAIQVAVTTPSWPAAGSFTVQQDGVAVSAGLFTKDGVLVNSLFQNLPLQRGEHEFWLPAHDWQGLEIADGAYEVRVVESKLRMDYLGLVFNTARSSRRRDHDSFHAQYAAFRPDGGIIFGRGWSEAYLQIRTFDAAYGEAGWSVGGASAAHGMALDGEGHLYFLSGVGKDEASGRQNLSLTKVQVEDGTVVPVTAAHPSPVFMGLGSETTDGLAVLGGRIYLSDPGSGRILHTRVHNPAFEDVIELAAPRQIVADRGNNLLWVISGDRNLVVLAPDGKPVHTHDFPYAIHRLSLANGRLAVLSRETGKIEIFRIASAQALALERTLGTGRDAYGPFEPDSFTFKRRANPCGIGLREDGALFVIDHPRTMLFGADSQLVRATICVWGQHLVQGKLAGDAQNRWWSVDSEYSMILDSAAGTWTPDGLWHYPAQPGLNRYRAAVDFFHDGERNFALFSGNWQNPHLTLLAFDGYRGRTVAIWRPDRQNPGIVTIQTDTNGDGIIDENDAPARELVQTEHGNWNYTLGHALPYLDHQTRDLWFAGGRPDKPGSFGQRVRYLGLDAEGIPTYDWAHVDILESRMPPEGTVEYISPFDFETREQINNRVGEFATFSDGTIAFSTLTKTGGGKGMGHVAGSDLAAASPDGRFRWFHPLPLTGGIHGIQVQDDILVTQNFTDMDWHMFNRDGLGLGIAGIPQEMHWTGMWNDHPRQYRLFKGNDGGIYAVLGDYMVTGFHHFRLAGADTIREQKLDVAVTPNVAATLAAQPRVPVPARIEPPAFAVTIRRLDAPLPMDGDLVKWREAGIQPQILVTPETAGGQISGPDDLSGVVRLAHENGNLYVQVIKFDDVVTMHQPLAKHYLQDSVEFCINGFLSGFKFNVTRTLEHGDTVFRDRFYHKEFNRVFTSAEVPRSIRVLDHAADVEERGLIESIYGVDLANSPVIVTEFKLPLELAFEGDPKAGPKGVSGETMWIGIMLDDNDEPGSDRQDLLVYPATYSTFSVKERGALATFE